MLLRKAVRLVWPGHITPAPRSASHSHKHSAQGQLTRRYVVRVHGGPPNSTHSGRANTWPLMRLHIDEGVGCVLGFGADVAFAGSQPDHAFPAPDGSWGHARTCNQDGSGP
jgi:hypothetical protein